ncbi:hypothetical protein RJT34_32590 [Clitoria ternatea]|uniref:Uncharacterized protein n=1 Tax=Clitoria ternatea TaxID=43366 RepID=A0AAN9EYL4_CLITE
MRTAIQQWLIPFTTKRSDNCRGASSTTTMVTYCGQAEGGYEDSGGTSGKQLWQTSYEVIVREMKPLQASCVSLYLDEVGARKPKVLREKEA